MNEYLKLEYIVSFSLIGSVLLTILVILTNNFNKIKLIKEIDDKNESMVKTLISELRDFKTLSWVIYKKDVDSYIKKTESLLSNLTQESKYFVESKKFKLFLNQEELSNQIKKERLESHIEQLNKNKITPETSLAVKHNYYYVQDSDYRKLVGTFSDWSTAKKYYDELISSINEALDSVDSAQMTETIDLFSSNKGVSMLSTMNNNSANSDVDKVSENYSKLKNHLESIKSQMNSSQSSLQKINDIPDLMVDILFDFSFDFMSVFSLSKLNDMESDLKEFQKNIFKLGPEINLRFDQSKNNQDQYLNSKD